MSDFPSPADLAEAALRLGREGASRREIATALGMTLAELAAREAADAAVARAMALADEAAWSWWEGAPRAAFMAGTRINMAAWRAAMAWRFGAPAAPPAAAAPVRRAIYEFPDNGTSRSQTPAFTQPRDFEAAEDQFQLWKMFADFVRQRLKSARQYLDEFERPADYDGDCDDEDDETRNEDEEEDEIDHERD